MCSQICSFLAGALITGVVGQTVLRDDIYKSSGNIEESILRIKSGNIEALEKRVAALEAQKAK